MVLTKEFCLCILSTLGGGIEEVTLLEHAFYVKS